MRLVEIEERIPNWVLDRQTREVGLKGVAVARAILEKKSGKNSPSYSREMKKCKIAGNRYQFRQFRLCKQTERVTFLSSEHCKLESPNGSIPTLN